MCEAGSNAAAITGMANFRGALGDIGRGGAIVTVTRRGEPQAFANTFGCSCATSSANSR
jgi:hypothetical protein